MATRTTPATGTDRQRLATAAAGKFLAEEVHTTRDHGRAWMGGTRPLTGAVYLGSVATQTTMLALFTSGAKARGCFEGDECYRSDTLSFWKCIANNGTLIGEWQEMSTTAGTVAAADVTYDPTASGLSATDVQAAIDELQPLSSELSAFAALTNTAGVLTNDGSGGLSWVAGGSGTISGTGTDNHLMRWDGTANAQDSAAILSDNGELVVTGATSSTYRQVLSIEANATNGIEFKMNNTHSGGTLKSQLSFYSQNNLKWAFGNDSLENGTDDFWIYQNSASSFRFQIKSDGTLKLGAYGTGVLQSDGSGNISAAPKVLATGGATPSSGTSGLTIWASGGLPIVSWVESAASSGSKVWDFLASSGVLHLRAVTDAYSGASDLMTFTHAGDVAFPQIALTTGLSIAIATKSFPLTINGTTVNVLCQ